MVARGHGTMHSRGGARSVCFDDRFRLRNRNDLLRSLNTSTAKISANWYRIYASKQHAEANPANITCTTGKQVILVSLQPSQPLSHDGSIATRQCLRKLISSELRSSLLILAPKSNT
jgi:hypothetical protein